MLTVQPFNSRLGFGSGAKSARGEYYYSQGMRKTAHGVTPGWLATALADSSTLTDLGLPNWFAQALINAIMHVFHVDQAGNIFKSQGGTGAWAFAYKPIQTTYGNGLLGDQKGRLLYPMTRYLGLYDSSADYATGTIDVTNGSPNVTGTGTSWTSGMADRRILINNIWYTVQSVTDATHLVLTANYAGATDTGLSYSIKTGWNDQFKDFGAGSLPSDSDYRNADLYEDWAVICNGNKLALFNITDDSFDAAAFSLPSNFKFRSVKSGRTGILCGANIGNRCVLFLWAPGYIRSISPWIWLNATIQAIVPYGDNWIVITNRHIILTNGYTYEALPAIPDTTIEASNLQIHPQGVTVVDNYLILANNVAQLNRIRSGLWILDLMTRLWEYAPVANGATYNNTMRCIFFDSNIRTHIAWKTEIPSRNVLGALNNGAPATSYLITEPLASENANGKYAHAVSLNLGLSTVQSSAAAVSGTVSVKVFTFRRKLWNYAQQKVTATDYNKITVDGSVAGLNDAELGDEVTVLEGTNAGQTAHIQSIAGKDTATEVWTLDRNLTGYTEANVLISVSPFKLVKTHTLSSLSELSDLWFAARNRSYGKRFLLKILLEGMSGPALEILDGQFIYDDTGTI